MTRDQLETDLRSLPKVQSVSVEGNGQLIATVVSGSFEQLDEGKRQKLVWTHLWSRHSDEPYQLSNIEFIFTNAPDEEKPGEIEPDEGKG